MVGAELRLEAVSGGAFGAGHDTRVVDQDVELVGACCEKLSGEFAHGGEAVEVQMQEVEFSGLEDGGKCILAFGEVACGAEDVCAGGFEGTRGFDADS